MSRPIRGLMTALAVTVTLAAMMLMLVGPPRHAQAQEELSQFRAFGTLGLMRGTTLVLTVMNLQDPDSR
jgi:hypothetical protein